MSSPERRAQRRKEFEQEQAERAAEQARKDALSLYMRIEESDASEDMKYILHRLADAAGVE